MPLVENFLAGARGRSLEADAALAEWLETRLPELARAFPSVARDLPAFAEFLGEKVGADPDVLGALASLHLADLFLSWACAAGDGAALLVFDREYLAQVQKLSRGVDPAELEQCVRVRLLLSESGEPPRIRQYSGRGPLRAWVRMTAARVAIDLARSNQVAPQASVDLSSLSTPVDPEIDYLKVRYRSEFRAALEQTLQAMSSKDATLLKLSYLENAPPSAIGRMYSVSSRTVQRWLVEARKRLLEGTRAALAERLSLPPSELDSLMLLVHSQLHLSLARVLLPERAAQVTHDSKQ